MARFTLRDPLIAEAAREVDGIAPQGPPIRRLPGPAPLSTAETLACWAGIFVMVFALFAVIAAGIFLWRERQVRRAVPTWFKDPPQFYIYPQPSPNSDVYDHTPHLSFKVEYGFTR